MLQSVLCKHAKPPSVDWHWPSYQCCACRPTNPAVSGCNLPEKQAQLSVVWWLGGAGIDGGGWLAMLRSTMCCRCCCLGVTTCTAEKCSPCSLGWDCQRGISESSSFSLKHLACRFFCSLCSLLACLPAVLPCCDPRGVCCFFWALYTLQTFMPAVLPCYPPQVACWRRPCSHLTCGQLPPPPWHLQSLQPP